MTELTDNQALHLRQIERFNDEGHGLSEGGARFKGGGGFLQLNVGILDELRALGLARRHEDGLWWITEAGREVLKEG